MKKQLFIYLLMMFLSVGSYAQSGKITGTVANRDGEPLPGVTVVVKGTSNGTVTNADGVYSIQAENGQVLQFSFVGMQSKEITIVRRFPGECNTY